MADPDPGFEFATDPAASVVAVIRFGSPGLFRLFCRRHLEPAGALPGLALRQAVFPEGREEVLVLAEGPVPEVHAHGGPAQERRWRELLVGLARELPGHVPPPELEEARAWEAAFRRTGGLRGIAHLLARRPGDGAGGGAWSPEFLRPVRVVLAGPANSGKSTLFNRILGDARALVSPRAGTTRDALLATLQVGGFEVELADTAGLDAVGAAGPEAADIHAQAEACSREAMAAADVLLWLGPAAAVPPGLAAAVILLAPKADLGGEGEPGALPVSGLSGLGVDRLLGRLREAVAAVKADLPA